jgi:hypothetical protein
MRMVYGFLCDYAAAGAGNKPTAVGIFDAIWTVSGNPVTLPNCFLHAQFDAPGSGPRRLLSLTLIDADGETIDEAEMPITLAPRRRLGMGGYLYLSMPTACCPASAITNSSCRSTACASRRSPCTLAKSRRPKSFKRDLTR